MARVRCTIPNADTEISGVAFMPAVGGGMVSEDIDEVAAARFASIPGYALVEDASGKLSVADPLAVSEAAAVIIQASHEAHESPEVPEVPEVKHARKSKG